MRYGTEHGFFELNNFPGCNQLVISNHAFIMPEFRGTGKGTAAHQQRLDQIKKMGYDAAICTVREDNEVQKHILETFKWVKVFRFLNKETNNGVEVWMRTI